MQRSEHICDSRTTTKNCIVQRPRPKWRFDVVFVTFCALILNLQNANQKYVVHAWISDPICATNVRRKHISFATSSSSLFGVTPESMQQQYSRSCQHSVGSSSKNGNRVDSNKNSINDSYSLSQDRNNIVGSKSPTNERDFLQGRRGAIVSLAQASTVLLLSRPIVARASTSGGTSSDALDNLSLGEGRWRPMKSRTSGTERGVPTTAMASTPPANFCTYAARFLLTFDGAAQSWWRQLQGSLSLLPSEDERRARLGRSFASFARSVEAAIEEFLLEQQQQQQQQRNDIIQQQQQNRQQKTTLLTNPYEQLWDLFQERYGLLPDAQRQIAILFALLPPDDQPLSRLKKAAEESSSLSSKQIIPAQTKGKNIHQLSTETKLLLDNYMTAVLPPDYECVQIMDEEKTSSSYFRVEPPISLFEIGIGQEFGQTAIATAFGPLSEKPLTRGQPLYSFPTYALFGLSGATGCALTHTIVIPLDVVKTKNQVNPGAYKTFLGSAVRIAREEGINGLLLGAQATIVGYLWYGLSVYPSYSFFKRWLTLSVFPPEVAVVHGNDIALVAGALAAVIASFGLTPIEAARIRVVADPETYRPLGLTGTLGVIAREEPSQGWKNLYAGLSSLLTRQVIFGSVKFLAFERACDLIFGTWPFLHDTTLTSLAVSLVAGGLSGTVSSIVSQPADSVLTFVAQDSEGSGSNLGVIDGCIKMVEKNGPASLFRGLGSRCIWAGSIIAGQFLLYDIFRTFFGVNSDDLSQVYELVIPTIN